MPSTNLKRTRLKQVGGAFVGADQKHIKNILAALDMQDCKPAASPTLTKEPEEGEELDRVTTKIYRSCVGTLLYILDDRPDLLRDGGLLAGGMSKPLEGHLQRLKHLVRYLAGTYDLGTWMPQPRPGKHVELTCWSDTNWASKETGRKSVSCGVIEAGGCVLPASPRGRV